MPKHSPRIALAALALALALPLEAAADDGWDWQVAPYLWFPTVSVDFYRDLPAFGDENRFPDIVSEVDGAFMLHAEGQGDRFGVFGDVTFFSVGEQRSRPAFATDSGIDATVFEVAGVWNVEPERYKGLELFGGLRYFDVDFDASITPTNPIFSAVSFGEDRSYADFLLGARYHASLSERWGMTLRGDGSWGESDGSFGASAMFSFSMTHGAWLFGYRYLQADLPTPGQSMEIDLSGPVVAYAFRF
ncbi:hypothetical protein [Arenimonas daejeonensis]|uniref:hypothetical protein n=1 Tax=Arenimonas daejeonensis TaxID=370777 RepID=UPI0011BF6B54|nr:hypothetical protein [Arenimonas daejeonensis]